MISFATILSRILPKHTFWVCLLLTIFVFRSWWWIKTDSITFDEPLHIQSGIEWFNTGTSPTDPFNPFLAKLPFGLLDWAGFDLFTDPFLTIPRLVTIGESLVLIVLIYLFTLKHSSRLISFITLVLLTSEPVFLSFSHLATTDIAATLTFFFATMSFTAYQTKQTTSNLFLCFLGFTLVILTKTILLPAILVVVFFLCSQITFLLPSSYFKRRVGWSYSRSLIYKGRQQSQSPNGDWGGLLKSIFFLCPQITFPLPSSYFKRRVGRSYFPPLKNKRGSVHPQMDRGELLVRLPHLAVSQVRNDGNINNGTRNPKLITYLLFTTFYLLFSWSLTGFRLIPITHTNISLPLGELINTTLRAMSYVFNSKYDTTRNLFFFGLTRGHGWFSYPLVSLLIKTSPITLILAIKTILSVFSKHNDSVLSVITFSIGSNAPPQKVQSPISKSYLQSLTCPPQFSECETRRNRRVNKSEKCGGSHISITSFLSILLLITLGRYSTGIRHLLPAYPFLTILAAISLSKLPKWLISLVLVVVVTQSIFINDPISYFSPFIGSKLGGKIVVDNSLDWGQNLYRLHQEYPHLDYIRSHSPADPKLYGISALQLPLPQNLNTNTLIGKTVAISRTRYYLDGYYLLPLFHTPTTFAASNTIIIFSF